MKTGVVVVAVVLLAALSAVSAKQSSPQMLFERALALEEVQGKLTEAIAVYEKVVSEPGDKALAAQAQLHIGLCYEKMGVEKAREAYEKVIKNYPGQTASVAAARERLDSLMRAASLARKGEGGVTIRKVPRPKGWSTVTGAVSPDGTYLADLAEVGGEPCELRVTEILTGRERFLTTRGECSWSPRWSPDSTKLAVLHKPGLSVIALDGSAPRVLVDLSADDRRLEPLDWSPDGKYILNLVWSASGKAPDVSLVAVGDGSVRPLRTQVVSGLGFDYRFSPDRLAIAYSRDTAQGKRDIFLLPVDGSGEIPLVQHPADDALVEWLPDGRGILFASDRAGTSDLWSIEINQGQPQGVPTLVRRSIGPITPMRLTSSGAFYFETPASFMDVYTVGLDPKTGQVLGPPKKEPLPYEGSNRFPSWSADGKHLAYVSNRPTAVGPYFPGRARQFIVSVYSADTGKVREYPGVRTSSPRWSPDGRHLYAAGSMSGPGIHRLDVTSGESTVVVREANGGGVEVSADGQWMIFCRNRRMLRRNLQSGEEKELDGPDIYPGQLALSRDGSRLAWVIGPDEKSRILKVMSFPDGTPREIQRLRNPDSRIAWSPDGRFVYYSDLPPGGGRDCHLWRVPADGGNPQDLGSVANFHEHLSIHPDGTRITFSTSTLNPEPAQLWVMENFLPPPK